MSSVFQRRLRSWTMGDLRILCLNFCLVPRQLKLRRLRYHSFKWWLLGGVVDVQGVGFGVGVALYGNGLLLAKVWEGVSRM